MKLKWRGDGEDRAKLVRVEGMKGIKNILVA